MTDDNKPPMFGPSFVIDLTNHEPRHEPRSGKSFWMAETSVGDLKDKADIAKIIIGNCTTLIPMKFEFDGVDTGHTVVIGPTGKGLSADGAS